MGQETEHFEFTEHGQLIRLNGGQIYLRYLEHQDQQATPVQFRFDEERVQLDRRGPRQTRLIFEEGAATTTRYQTEYGVIHLVVETRQLIKKLDFTAHQGTLQAVYRLKNQGQILGTYRIQLQFAPWYCNM